MFGFVQICEKELSDEELARYRAFYCGICHTLGEEYRQIARLALSYDLTFLAIFFSSLYEPAEQQSRRNCLVHPFKQHEVIQNEFTSYAADMTVALTYHKCMDDWKDDHNLLKRGYAAALQSSYDKVKEKHPLPCRIIEESLAALLEAEKANCNDPDLVSSLFGRLMAGIFGWKQDHWTPYVSEFAFHLGAYIELADAACDLESDRKKGRYNPFSSHPVSGEELRGALKTILGAASEVFEKLPLEQDLEILKNILYSGIWIAYNTAIEGQKRRGKRDARSL